MLLTNEIKFDSTTYAEDSIVPQAVAKFIRFSSQIHQNFPMQVANTQLILQDLAIDLDQLTELEDDSIFNIESLPSEIVGLSSDTLATLRF